MCDDDGTWEMLLNEVAGKLGECKSQKSMDRETGKVLDKLSLGKMAFLPRLGEVLNLILRQTSIANDEDREKFRAMAITLRGVLKRKRSASSSQEIESPEFLESSMGFFAGAQAEDRERTLTYALRQGG